MRLLLTGSPLYAVGWPVPLWGRNPICQRRRLTLRRRMTLAVIALLVVRQDRRHCLEPDPRRSEASINGGCDERPDVRHVSQGVRVVDEDAAGSVSNRRRRRRFSRPPQGAGLSPDWARNAQKRCINLATEILERQRESFDALFKSTINLLQQTSQISESKSPEDYRRATEDLWRKWFESVKSHSETQFRDVQTFAGKSLEIVQSAQKRGRGRLLKSVVVPNCGPTSCPYHPSRQRRPRTSNPEGPWTIQLSTVSAKFRNRRCRCSRRC